MFQTSYKVPTLNPSKKASRHLIYLCLYYRIEYLNNNRFFDSFASMRIEKEEVLALVRKYLDTPSDELKAFCHYFVGEIQSKGKTNAVEAPPDGVSEESVRRLQGLQYLALLAVGIVQTSGHDVKVEDLSLEVALRGAFEMPTAFYFNLNQNGCDLHISFLSFFSKDTLTVNVTRSGSGVGKMLFINLDDVRGLERPSRMSIAERGSLLYQAGTIARLLVDQLESKDGIDEKTLI